MSTVEFSKYSLCFTSMEPEPNHWLSRCITEPAGEAPAPGVSAAAISDMVEACFEYAHLPGHIPGAQECPIHAGLCHDMGSPSKKKEAAYEKTQTAYCEQQGPGCAWGHLPLVHCAPLSSSGVPASEGHKGDSVSNRAVAQWLWHIAMHHRVASSDGLSTERYA